MYKEAYLPLPTPFNDEECVVQQRYWFDHKADNIKMPSWTLTKSMLKKLDAFESLAYRMLRISWEDRILNEIALRRMQSQRRLNKTMKGWKIQYFGQFVRGRDFQRVLMGVKAAGKRGRCRNILTRQHQELHWFEL